MEKWEREERTNGKEKEIKEWERKKKERKKERKRAETTSDFDLLCFCRWLALFAAGRSMVPWLLDRI